MLYKVVATAYTIEKLLYLKRNIQSKPVHSVRHQAYVFVFNNLQELSVRFLEKPLTFCLQTADVNLIRVRLDLHNKNRDREADSPRKLSYTLV